MGDDLKNGRADLGKEQGRTKRAVAEKAVVLMVERTKKDLKIQIIIRLGRIRRAVPTGDPKDEQWNGSRTAEEANRIETCSRTTRAGTGQRTGGKAELRVAVVSSGDYELQSANPMRIYERPPVFVVLQCLAELSSALIQSTSGKQYEAREKKIEEASYQGSGSPMTELLASRRTSIYLSRLSKEKIKRRIGPLSTAILV
ncbi:hypothetical protein NUW58_g680 [Xylaria curta]|uniref:Uncharacterized protein n=1 Tax=Xylaria curta TaxID=42375 RepID=A0ACC1PQC5_9PEZI|nr:hypothetical protein NUW58_g680 [Xylaria curta]